MFGYVLIVELHVGEGGDLFDVLSVAAARSLRLYTVLTKRDSCVLNFDKLYCVRKLYRQPALPGKCLLRASEAGVFNCSTLSTCFGVCWQGPVQGTGIPYRTSFRNVLRGPGSPHPLSQRESPAQQASTVAGFSTPPFGPVT